MFVTIEKRMESWPNGFKPGDNSGNNHFVQMLNVKQHKGVSRRHRGPFNLPEIFPSIDYT